MVGLVQSRREPEQLAREFEPSAQTIRNSVVQAARDSAERTDGPSSADAVALRRLRRENRRLREEHGIVEKATAWFARETSETPSGSSSSSR